MSYLKPDQNKHFKSLPGLKMVWERMLKPVWGYAGLLSVYVTSFSTKSMSMCSFLPRNKPPPKLASVRGVVGFYFKRYFKWRHSGAVV